MAAIDKLYLKDYYQFNQLRTWAIIYYPKLLMYFYDYTITEEDFEKWREEWVNDHMEFAERDYKKLAEILPLESADMYYPYFGDNKWGETARFGEALEYSGKKDIPCWSLAALLNILESEIYDEDGNTYELNIEKDGTWWWIEYIERYGEKNPIEINSTEELIDACSEMILKLHELKML